MSPRFLAVVAALALASIAAGPVSLAQAQGSDARYTLVHGCYGLRSAALGRFVAKSPDGSYRTSASAVSGAEPFRMQATALGSYLLYGPKGDFAAAPAARMQSAAQPSDRADWRVDDAGPGLFTITLPADGKALAAAADGSMVLVAPQTAGKAGQFSFEPASGCAVFPEAETSATGTPGKGTTSYGEVSGYIDAHIHMMAYEFLGGRAHCGRPWHRFGVTYALRDCPDHYPNGGAAVLEQGIRKNGPGTHDPVGWPTFKDWPAHGSLTHEQTYYKWLERAWLGGLRTYVNLFVENKVLCNVYPYKQNSCNEDDSVRLQSHRIRELENYIDAQSGGPGKGFFRIVTNPFQARQVINAGKLAVVLGIEVSEPFGCQVYNDKPQCDTAQIDRGLDEVYKFGVRDMELVNKFDNALGGVAGDTGTTGAIVNQGNRAETGRYWQMQACNGPADESDREQPSAYSHNDDSITSNGIESYVPLGLAPIYPAGAQCNARGLTMLGEHLIRRMIAKHMIVDPDHLSVLARKHVMSLLEAARYSGVVSSHSWSTIDAFPRMYKLGGVVTPYAGDSTGFVKAWKTIKPMQSPDHYWGFGYGADMNGFGAQGGPRNGPNPVKYPFKSAIGNVTLDREKSGSRRFDINVDGVAHYGLYPDWIEDLRMIAGDQIVKDMARGSEAYLQMWERAEGIPARHCRTARGVFTSRGLAELRLGDSTARLLRRAGQPINRLARVWDYCVASHRLGRGRSVAVLTPQGRVGLVGTTAVVDRVVHIRRGGPASGLRETSKAFGPGTRIGRTRAGLRFIYGVRRGRVSFLAVATPSVTRSPARLGAYLKLAGLR